MAKRMKYARHALPIGAALALCGAIKTVKATSALRSADNAELRKQRREWQLLWGTVAVCGATIIGKATYDLYDLASLFQRVVKIV